MNLLLPHGTKSHLTMLSTNASLTMCRKV